MNDRNDAATVLVVDDDEAIRTLLRDALAGHGFRALAAPDAAQMYRLLRQEAVDAILLDVMMPGQDGLSACRELAARRGPPVILLSALGEETDRIAGLERGADRYLQKPCSVAEIVANLRTVLRRGEAPPRRAFRFAGYRVDLDAHEAHDRNGVLVHLSDGEFAVLRVFLERPNRVLTREDILQAARGRDTESFDRAVDIQVSRLRRKLPIDGGELIRTVRNEGYLFVPRLRP